MMTEFQELTDVELIQRCLELRPDGVHEPFEELYSRHVRVVLAFLRRLLNYDEHAVLDALQESFVRLYRALPNFKQDRSLRPWLLTIARNVSLDYLKHSSRNEQCFDQSTMEQIAKDDSSNEERQAKELEEMMQRALLSLNVDERAIFHLKNELGLTYEQASEILGCSVRTAKYRMKAALERLGRELERLGLGV
ncbi:MAG: sigma-70 family RNA polymerase sigma factor [Planctomycetota bacterium]|nr:sigma-70 family RNA polymerase sigma factor [Planctomycetota bacterium]